MEPVLNVTLPFFAVIACGFVAGRTGFLGPGAVRSLNAFVFYFALPALLIRSLANQPIKEIIDLSFVAAWALSGVLMFVVIAIVAKLAFRKSAGQAAILAQCGAAGNIVFLGFPMLIALVGDWATAPVALVASVDVVILMPIAIIMLEASRGEATHWLGSLLQVMRTMVVHPIIISIAAGLGLSLLEIPFNVPVDSFLEILGAAAAPGALFALGAFLGVNPKGGGLTAVAVVTLLKLFAYPALVWIAMTMVFDVNAQWAMVGTLLAALPTAQYVFIFAERYETYTAHAAAAINVTTALAVVTFSALAVQMAG